MLERRHAAKAEAEQRTVAALETMSKEAPVGKRGTPRRCCGGPRGAGVAGIVAVALTALVPVAQA
jgi:hypothetical protein